MRNEQGRVLYRAMREDERGRPRIGWSSTRLGVRVAGRLGRSQRADIVPDGAGFVGPGTGGMSVRPDRRENIPDDLLAPKYGGTGECAPFRIREAQLPQSLQYRPEAGKETVHGFIEPAIRMHVDDYEKALFSTVELWEIEE